MRQAPPNKRSSKFACRPYSKNEARRGSVLSGTGVLDEHTLCRELSTCHMIGFCCIASRVVRSRAGGYTAIIAALHPNTVGVIERAHTPRPDRGPFNWEAV